MSRALTWTLAAASVITCGCVECFDRAGCDATSRVFPDPSIEQGIAGFAMTSSDVITLCNPCPLIDAHLLLWPTEAEIVDADGANAVLAGDVARTISISHERGYEEELAPGHYFVCTDDLKSCATVEVRAGAVVTLHYLAVGDDALKQIGADGSDVPLQAFECDIDTDCADCDTEASCVEK